MKMKILLTGNKGYIGKHLHSTLGVRYDLDTIDEGTNYNAWLSEFTKRTIMPYPKVIVHCGGNPDSSYTHPDIFQWNYDATRRIADFAVGVNAHLIFFSSSCAIRPDCHYGWSKRTAEDYIRSRLNGKYTNLRIFNVYGREAGRKTKSVPQQIADRTLDKLYTPFTRDYIHIQDVKDAILHVIKSEIFGTYEVGAGIPVQPRDIANLVGWKPNTIVKPPPELPAYKVAVLSNMLPSFKCQKDIFSEIPLMIC